MPHVAHVAFLNFAEIHPSDEVADSEKVLLSFDLITEVWLKHGTPLTDPRVLYSGLHLIENDNSDKLLKTLRCNLCPNLSHKVKRQFVHSRLHAHYFHLPWTILEEIIANNQCSSITKGGIYHMKHNVHTTFYHGRGLAWNWMLNGINAWYLHILHFFTLYRRTHPNPVY